MMLGTICYFSSLYFLAAAAAAAAVGYAAHAVYAGYAAANAGYASDKIEFIQKQKEYLISLCNEVVFTFGKEQIR